MEANVNRQDHAEDDEEFVLLDLNVLDGTIDIPQNAPYVLSGLNTPNPILVIDGKLKLIGEYEETIGTSLIFSEDEVAPVVHEETGPSEANLFAGKRIVDSRQEPERQVKPVACVHKILKFKVLVGDDNDSQDVNIKSTNETSSKEDEH